MSKVCINIDDLIGVGNISKIHEETLRHAAEISPFVRERTIGPDKEEWQESPAADKEGSAGPRETSQKSPEKAAKSPIMNPVLMQNFDFETVNASVLMREAEEGRKRLIRQKMLEIQEKYLERMRQNAAKERQVKEQQITASIAEKRRSEAQLLQEAEEQTTQQLKESERQLEEIRLQAKRQLQMMCFQGVAKYHSTFRSKYEDVAKLLVSIDKQALLAFSDYNRQLKELVEKFDQLIGKIKAGECGAAELKLADGLCVSLATLQMTIHEDWQNLMKKQQKDLQEKQKQEQKAAVAAAVTATLTAAASASTPVSVVPQAVVPNLVEPPTVVASITPTETIATAAATLPAATTGGDPCPSFYNEIYSFYQEKVESVKPLQSDENMKKYRFACQKAINIPVNAISAVSPQHLQDKFEKIYSFLKGQPLKTAEGQISVNDHPLGRSYCLLLTAKKFVNQGETAISSNPQAAFPVASVVVSLWKLVPDFGKLFLAYIFKESPFLVPKRGQSVEEYHDLKRQAGITRLYGAVMVTCGRQADGPAHPYGIEHAWRWLIDFASIDPLPDISATLILELLQIVGANMWQAYGKQFAKLLVYIQRDYYPRLAVVDEGGPKARLEMLLISYLNQKQIPKPQGMLPPTFW